MRVWLKKSVFSFSERNLGCWKFLSCTVVACICSETLRPAFGFSLLCVIGRSVGWLYVYCSLRVVLHVNWQNAHWTSQTNEYRHNDSISFFSLSKIKKARNVHTHTHTPTKQHTNSRREFSNSNKKWIKLKLKMEIFPRHWAYTKRQHRNRSSQQRNERKMKQKERKKGVNLQMDSPLNST